MMHWWWFGFGVVFVMFGVAFWCERHDSDSYGWSIFWTIFFLGVGAGFINASII